MVNDTVKKMREIDDHFRNNEKQIMEIIDKLNEQIGQAVGELDKHTQMYDSTMQDLENQFRFSTIELDLQLREREFEMDRAIMTAELDIIDIQDKIYVQDVELFYISNVLDQLNRS